MPRGLKTIRLKFSWASPEAVQELQRPSRNGAKFWVALTRWFLATTFFLETDQLNYIPSYEYIIWIHEILYVMSWRLVGCWLSLYYFDIICCCDLHIRASLSITIDYSRYYIFSSPRGLTIPLILLLVYVSYNHCMVLGCTCDTQFC